MTYINNNQNNSMNLICPKVCIFNLGLKIYSDTSLDLGNHMDFLCLSYNSISNINILYQNNTSFPLTSISRPQFSYENLFNISNFKKNDETDFSEDYIPYNILQGSGNSQTILFSNNASFPRKFYLSELELSSNDPPLTNTSSLTHEGTSFQTPNFSSLRLPFRKISQSPGYLYKFVESPNKLKLPTIVLSGGYEYYIEITNVSKLIMFNDLTGIYNDQNRKDKNINSKVYIDNNSFTPVCNISFYERNINIKKYLDINYIFSDYSSLSSQWGSKIMIYQIPIV
jgi:hypothetical protein